MPKIKVNRFIQDPSCCAIASCSCVSNYWDKEVDYIKVKDVAVKKFFKNREIDGLDSGDICILLNELGFNKVTLISSSMSVFDYTWEKFNRNKIINKLDEALLIKKCKDEKRQVRCILKWIKDKRYDNDIIIDYNFGKYIRDFLRRKKPLVISFNWTMFFKYNKFNEKGYEDNFNGETEYHAAVVYGYDTKGVHICDSHNSLYTYKRKKYRSGFYKMSWENLMTVMGEGDVFLPDQYVKRT